MQGCDDPEVCTNCIPDGPHSDGDRDNPADKAAWFKRILRFLRYVKWFHDSKQPAPKRLQTAVCKVKLARRTCARLIQRLSAALLDLHWRCC